MNTEIVKGSASGFHVLKVTNAAGNLTYQVFSGATRIHLPYIEAGEAVAAFEKLVQEAVKKAKAITLPSSTANAPGKPS